MLKLIIRTRFDHDMKLARKRNKKIDALHKIVDTLQADIPLATKHRPHLLGGEWHNCWECHIKPDWLLIYQLTDDEIIFIRTGTHSDLFG